MAENQGDIYVRRDVFEARMDRMEMLLEKTVIEIKAYVDKSTGETKTYVEKAIGGLRDEVKSEIGGLRAEFGSLRAEFGSLRAEVVEVKNEVKVLTARVDSMENVLYWGLGLFGIILAVATLLPSILESVRRFIKPTHFKEEMEKIAERVANTVIERHLSGGKTE